MERGSVGEERWEGWGLGREEQGREGKRERERREGWRMKRGMERGRGAGKKRIEGWRLGRKEQGREGGNN